MWLMLLCVFVGACVECLLHVPYSLNYNSRGSIISLSEFEGKIEFHKYSVHKYSYLIYW